MTDRELIQQATALSLEIVEAFLADENDGGFDISAGCFGPNFTELICRWAKAEWNAELSKRLAQPEQEPFEYWNAVEGWVKIDEVRTQFGSVGCGTIYKTAGEDRVPLYTAPPQRKPLTEEEIGLLTTDPRFAHIETPTLAEFARAVIAKVTGEKK